MAQFRSTATAARPKSASLRTTIPESIVKLIGLEPGDELVWDIAIISKGVEIKVNKA